MYAYVFIQTWKYFIKLVMDQERESAVSRELVDNLGLIPVANVVPDYL